jgi:uncharacterized protein YoxC
MLLLSSTAGSIAYVALAFFLIAIGLTLGYAFLRLAGAFGRVSSLVKGVEQEVLPVINKAGGSIDRVNGQLDKLDVVTDSAVSAVGSIDSGVRTVAGAVKVPARKIAAASAGLAHGFASFKVERDFAAAMAAARFAAQERENRFAEEFDSQVEEEKSASEE